MGATPREICISTGFLRFRGRIAARCHDWDHPAAQLLLIFDRKQVDRLPKAQRSPDVTNVMNESGQESLAGGRYRSRELSTDLPDQLDILHRSHRNFCARAMQELHRAERYRQYVSLVLVRENRPRTADNPYRDINGPLADVASLVRTNSRVTDLVSGVEGGRLAILLVETPPEGARRFIDRLNEMIESYFGGETRVRGNIAIPIELISFPEGGSNHITFAEALNTLYQQASVRPHIS